MHTLSGTDTWDELDDSIAASDGEETTWTDSDPERLTRDTGYYRIREN